MGARPSGGNHHHLRQYYVRQRHLWQRDAAPDGPPRRPHPGAILGPDLSEPGGVGHRPRPPGRLQYQIDHLNQNKTYFVHPSRWVSKEWEQDVTLDWNPGAKVHVLGVA